MFPCAIKICIQTLMLIIVLTYVHGQDRQITSKLNPGCVVCNATKSPLIYIRAQGSKDTIHQLWDFTDHVPAMVYAVGSPNSTLDIYWTSTRPAKFHFSEQPSTSYSFAAAIDSIIEYNDLKDNGYYDQDSISQTWSLDRLSWRLTDSLLTDKEVMVMLRGEEKWRNGTLDIKLDLLPFKDYATDLPHLIHTANSTLVDIQLVNYTEYRKFNSSRFALHLVLVSTDPPQNSWEKNMRKSLDDEHTPGVFEIIEIKSAKCAKSGDGGFIQFRPVAYTEPDRSVSSSTNAYATGFNRTIMPWRSIVGTFYRDCFGPRVVDPLKTPVDVVIQDIVVSFGVPGDGFYKQHNFTGWSFTIGYGTPPLESFSLYVLIIISIGLGVPILIALSGIAYVLLRRCKQRNPPTRFNNDE